MFDFDFDQLEEDESPREKFLPGRLDFGTIARGDTPCPEVVFEGSDQEFINNFKVAPTT